MPDSTIIEKSNSRVMTLLLECDPFRYLVNGCVFLLLSLMLTFMAYAPLEPFASARHDLFALFNSPTLTGVQSLAANYIKFFLRVMPLLMWLITAMTILMGYMKARELSKQSPEERQERRELYRFLDEFVEQERRRNRRGRLLPFTLIMLVACPIISAGAYFLPLSESTIHAISRPASSFSLVAMISLPFAMLGEGTYYIDKAREYLRGKLIASSQQISE